MSFLHGFVAIGTSKAEWTDERLRPLEAYVRSLRAPRPAMALQPARVEEGAVLFGQQGCLGCHAGPSGEGVRIFEFSEVGTDPAMRDIFSPDKIPGGEPCCGLAGSGQYSVTGGVKANRLTGLASQRRFLHNGSVGSLEALLCLMPRDPSTDLAQTSAGHRYGCDTLSEQQKNSLIEYLRSL